MADKRVNERCLVPFLKSIDFHLFYTYSWCVCGSVVFAIGVTLIFSHEMIYDTQMILNGE